MYKKGFACVSCILCLCVSVCVCMRVCACMYVREVQLDVHIHMGEAGEQ